MVSKKRIEKINKYTGGRCIDYTIKGSKPGEGELPNSFIAKDGTYIGNIERAEWYLKHNMVVCFTYPAGVGIILKHPVEDYEYLEAYKTDGQIGGDDIKSYYGYTHRGGCTFKLGDKLFEENYEPKEEDYTKEEWEEFKVKREESIVNNLKEGWVETREEAEAESTIVNVVPFNKRGKTTIETWEQAEQAAINMSNYLS